MACISNANSPDVSCVAGLSDASVFGVGYVASPTSNRQPGARGRACLSDAARLAAADLCDVGSVAGPFDAGLSVIRCVDVLSGASYAMGLYDAHLPVINYSDRHSDAYLRCARCVDSHSDDDLCGVSRAAGPPGADHSGVSSGAGFSDASDGATISYTDLLGIGSVAGLPCDSSSDTSFAAGSSAASFGLFDASLCVSDAGLPSRSATRIRANCLTNRPATSDHSLHGGLFWGALECGGLMGSKSGSTSS